ncbi:MAG TPA: peptide deformylase [Rectinemataceae bacterium]|nr:peptide deformylase [Rectinemataceae bacterium]
MLEVVTYGDPILEKPSDPVTEFDEGLAILCEEMFEAMRRDHGIGLAAAQVGVSKRVFVTNVDEDKKRIFINPEIVMTSPDLVEYEEGCLSFPGLYFVVKRSGALRIQAFNEKGRPFTVEADGLLARVILHEYDHLEGKLFIDRITPFKKERALLHYRRMIKM